MNERIKELAEQATETVKCGLNGTSTTESFNRKKFAELIVRECASKVDWIYAEKGITIDGVNFTVTQGDLIKEHFGVKE